MSDKLELPVPPRLKLWFEETISPWFGAVLVAAVFHAGLVFAMDIHWVLGLILTVGLALWLVALLTGLRRKLYEKYSWTMAGAMLLLTTLFAVGVFAAISMLIYRLDSGTYTGSSSITNTDFMTFYYWHTVDALPGLGLWHAYDVASPEIKQHGFLAGTSLLCFRAVVLATILSALKDWFARNRKEAAA